MVPRAAFWCWRFEEGDRQPLVGTTSHARASGLEFVQVIQSSAVCSGGKRSPTCNSLFDESAGRVTGLVNNLSRDGLFTQGEGRALARAHSLSALRFEVPRARPPRRRVGIVWTAAAPANGDQHRSLVPVGAIFIDCVATASAPCGPGAAMSSQRPAWARQNGVQGLGNHESTTLICCRALASFQSTLLGGNSALPII